MILSGILTTPTGFVYRNASVRLVGTTTIPFVTDSNGSYTVSAPNGAYAVEVAGGFGNYAHLGSILVETGGSTDILILISEYVSDPVDVLAAIRAPDGSDLIGYGIRTVEERLGDFISVRDYISTVIDGTTSNQTGIQAAVTAAMTANSKLYWPAGTYVSTANITNFWNVDHFGPGVLKVGSSLYHFSQYGNQLNQLFISPSGAGDGLSSSRPLGGITGAVNCLSKFGKLMGRWQVIGTSGTYSESVVIPDGLAQSTNYLEFKFPSAPGVRTDPDSWPAGGAVLDGTGLGVGIGFDTGSYNKIYIEYLKIANFYDTSTTNINQVRRGLAVDRFSFCYTHGCSYSGNGLANLTVLPDGSAYVVGGHMKGARYCIDNTGGRLSLTADETTYTVVQGGLEYGLYQKHQSSSVLDYTEFLDCGKLAAAASYGAAIFAYKPNASVDTRGCKYKRNNYVFNIRGGMVASNPGIPDVFGTGADANTRIWLTKGFGSDDILNYQSQSGVDITRSFGGGTVTGATTALAFDSQTTVPMGYLVGTDQSVRIKIYASNGAGGTAQIRPSFVTTGGTRYELANFQVAASTNAKIELEVFVSSGGTVASIYYENIGATLGGTLTGQIVVNPIPFSTEDLELQIWGETSSTNTLTIRKTRIERWG